jgi:hypothetical protein
MLKPINMKTPIEELERFLKGYQKQNGGDFPSPEIIYAQISMMKEEYSEKFCHTKEDMRNLYYATQQNDFWVKYDGFGGKEGYYTKTFEDE